MRMEVKRILCCDFCDSTEFDVDVIVTGFRDTAICYECAQICVEAAAKKIASADLAKSPAYDDLGPMICTEPRRVISVI